MKKSLFILVLAVTLFACEENDDGIKLQLNTESCTLDNETRGLLLFQSLFLTMTEPKTQKQSTSMCGKRFIMKIF